jgi:hypothetical protein
MARGRPKNLDKSIPIEIPIPESVYSRVQLELFSPLENRVPYGAMGKLITKLLSDWLKNERGI